MENLLNKIKCPNCKSKFEDNKNYPIILNCGHTICINCLSIDQTSNSTECPIDKVQTEDTNNLKENKIIKRILSILELRTMNYLSLTNLSFSYCYNCKMFLSNFSSKLHYFVNHKIYSLSKYTFNYFLQIEKGSESNKEINPFIQFYFNLYLFQKDNIFKDSEIKEIKEDFPCNEDSYLFYGERYEGTEENRIFYNILKFVIQYDSNDKRYSLKKGYLISQKNDFKMNGFYVTYKQIHNYMIRAIGLVNFRETIFFGLITFTQTQINSGSGFFLINGILDDGKSFKIGKFKENVNEYPSYELETGEIINYNLSLIDVKRTIVYAQEQITYNENFFNNIFFSCEDNDDGSYKIIIKKKITRNENIIFSFKNNKIEYIIFDYEEEQYIIIPLIQEENVVETHFSNCQINLKKKSISILYNKRIKGIIIIKDSKKLIGYLFQNKKSNENEIFKKYCEFKIKDIVYNLEEIIHWFQDFFEINLKNLDITFRLFNQDLNPKKDSNYFKFDCKKNRISDNEKTIDKTIDNLSDLSIYSILPDIYNNSLFQTIKEDLMKINFEKKKTTTDKDQCYIY